MTRIVYLDEAGVANIRTEPYLVVSGVITMPDRDWQRVEDFFEELISKVEKEIGKPVPAGFVFHAQDIWHGSRFWDRDFWPLEKRLTILMALAKAPAKFKLPVVYGFINRRAHRRLINQYNPDPIRPPKPNVIKAIEHAEGFFRSAVQVESWMRTHVPNEIAMLIAEDAPDARRAIKAIHSWYQQEPSSLTYLPDHGTPFHSKTIKDTVHFSLKQNAPFLQIADTCSFFIKRKLMKKKDSEQHFQAIRPAIVRESWGSVLKKLHPSAG